MQRADPVQSRDLKEETLDCDLAVVGGGLAGTCCAITAARAGARVVLLQDRPVLGGNASSEVRLVVCGASAYMANNNRWAREGGLIDEILVENAYRNPEGNPVFFDALLLDKAKAEGNLSLLLNTAAFAVEKSGPETITGVRAFCGQNSTMYSVRAKLFCDASGDGIVGFLAGAAFRMGAESQEEFGEKFAPVADYGELLGHSIYYVSKDAGHPVRYVPPRYALADITKIPRWRHLNAGLSGWHLWWLEYGGRLDTVHETEGIKWELWRVAYGIWDYIKNSGRFPEAANLTLEWVGLIPGKRESRRFEGDHILTQRDIVEQRQHLDAVAYGGWPLDLHPADGIYSERAGCEAWQPKGVYQIPFRCLYSRNVRNLLMAGRIISVTHVAFASTRVMGTCACVGQAAGMAAALCAREGVLPAELGRPEKVRTLQAALMRRGQYIPGFKLSDPQDLTHDAHLEASSQFKLRELPPDGPWLRLDESWCQMLPVRNGPAPRVTFTLKAQAQTEQMIRLLASARADTHTPEENLGATRVRLNPGEERKVTVDFRADVKGKRYLFYSLVKNPQVEVRLSEKRVTGVLAVSNSHTQEPQWDVGVETFEMWTPVRRPGGHNIACTIEPPLEVFEPENVRNGLVRPVAGPNAWVAGEGDPLPSLTLKWKEKKKIGRVVLSFDTDWDNPLESVLCENPERVMPFCVKRVRVRDSTGKILADIRENHQTRQVIRLDPAVSTDALTVELVQTWGKGINAALFEIRCYGP